MKKTRVPLLNQTVERWDSSNLSYIFYALSDPTRRSIINGLGRKSEAVSAIASNYYPLTLATISKHIIVLEHAGLIRKYRDGRRNKIALQIKSLKEVEEYVRAFTSAWDERYDMFKKNIEQGVRKRL